MSAVPPARSGTIIEFDTPRLRLRGWCDDDLPAFIRMCADPDVMAFFPAPLTPDQSRALAGRIRERLHMQGWGLWAVQTHEANDFLGFVGLNIPPAELPFSPCVEIGWRLTREAWGKGFATEAATGALAVGFQHLALDEIVAFTTLSNLRSQAVMQRLGMQRDAATFLHPLLEAGHPLREHVLYRLRRQKWLETHRPPAPDSV